MFFLQCQKIILKYGFTGKKILNFTSSFTHRKGEWECHLVADRLKKQLNSFKKFDLKLHISLELTKISRFFSQF